MQTVSDVVTAYLVLLEFDGFQSVVVSFNKGRHAAIGKAVCFLSMKRLQVGESGDTFHETFLAELLTAAKTQCSYTTKHFSYHLQTLVVDVAVRKVDAVWVPFVRVCNEVDCIGIERVQATETEQLATKRQLTQLE